MDRELSARRPYSGSVGRGIGLYVHLPFCVSRCAYCSFVTSTDLGLVARTVAAVAQEIGRLGGRGRRSLESLYLGGGTPSLLDGPALGAVFAAVERTFELVPGAEVTLEVNPDDVTVSRLAGWRSLGVNRISLGVQAFSDRVLEMLNRRHTAEQARAAAAVALASGLEVSLDLMLGLPLLHSRELELTVEEVLRLRPHHLSAYLLEMDKPHHLARLAESRPDLFPDPDATARQYLFAGRSLVGAGYRHYEVSNFALPGHAARHNTRYWLGSTVLAAGVSAHGQAGRSRWANVAELPGYLAAVEGGAAPRAWSRRLDQAEALRESVMVGLRLARGVDVATLRACGEAAPAFAMRLTEFLDLDLARPRAGRIRLTPRGWLVSNELFRALW